MREIQMIMVFNASILEELVYSQVNLDLLNQALFRIIKTTEEKCLGNVQKNNC